MKRFMISTVLVLSTLTGTPGIAAELSNIDLLEVRKFVPTADLSNLSKSQVLDIQNVLYSGGRNRGGIIRSILKRS